MRSLEYILSRYDWHPNENLGIRTQIPRDRRGCEDTGGRCHLYARERGLGRSQPRQQFDLRLLASATVRK